MGIVLRYRTKNTTREKMFGSDSKSIELHESTLSKPVKDYIWRIADYSSRTARRR